MKKTTIWKWVLQGLIFNILIFWVFIFIVTNYFVPNYFEIEEKKEKLNNLQLENKHLLNEWLSFIKFKKNFAKDTIENNAYLKNIVNDPSKEFKFIYESNLVNTWNKSYDKFISNKIIELKKKEEDLSKSKLKEKIEKILPYYKFDSSFKEEWLTDFKFINHIEKIIHSFNIDYIWTIWIWNFTLEDSGVKMIKNKKKKQEDWEIYSFKLPLTLIWSKKSLIDFLYYIENVWNISFTENNDDIKIKQVNSMKKYRNEDWIVIKNNFHNIWNYFPWENNIFNNLIIDIEKIKFEDYIDSSFDPIDYTNGETFLNFIKNDQTDEKYEIDIELKFYTKGLEKYKTKKYIQKVIWEYNELVILFSNTINFWKKNSSILPNKALLSLKELNKYNDYLKLLKDDIEELSNDKDLKENLWSIYRKAQSIKYIFDNNIKNIIETDLKNVSLENYNKYRKIDKIKTKTKTETKNIKEELNNLENK